MEQRRMSTRRGSLAEVRRGRVQVSARARQIALRAGTLAVAALALFLAACVTIRIDEPSGFAVSSNAGGRFKAVSPEGVLFAVRTEENYPEMDAAFWREAVKTQLVTEGYVILTGPESIEASGREGFLVEWGVPFRNDTYVYLTAVIPAGKTLYICEAGGPRLLYEEYRDAIYASIRSLAIGAGAEVD